VVLLAVGEKVSEVMMLAGACAARPIVPWPAVQVKTWKIAEGDAPETLSTNAIFFPSKERIGEVTILPPAVLVL
jgi:hypothetical protein